MESKIDGALLIEEVLVGRGEVPVTISRHLYKDVGTQGNGDGSVVVNEHEKMSAKGDKDSERQR